ncbi:hypothetical protein Ajs_3595 [Acidovorax sp. JS42]|nr:hypothetical protein Ajs_3595 [Acidovorax sp. JS42]
MLSAFSVEHCPPSRWNTVRHQHGIVSAIAWNTHQGMKAFLLAAMPVVLMDGTAPDLNHWLRIEPAIVAAVECRQALPLHVLEGIAPNAPGSWSLTPARSFTVFGLPVTRIELFIDPDGELGASYTAVIEKRSLEQVRKQLKLASQRGRIGQLSADQPSAEVQVTCTVAATEQG